VWLAGLLACVARGEPAAPAPIAAAPPMSRFDLVQGKPVTLADPPSTATLVSSKQTVALDPATGAKIHRETGILHLARGDQQDEIAWTLNAPFTWSGVPMVVRGTAGWYELVVRPDGRP
jgi:hypothetical protein